MSLLREQEKDIEIERL
jgi:hypothetical protein